MLKLRPEVLMGRAEKAEGMTGTESMPQGMESGAEGRRGG